MLGSLVERKNISTVEIDEGIVLVNNILLNVAKKANFVKIHKAHSRHKVVNTQDWFTKECRIRRNVRRQRGRELSKNPFNKGIRKKYLDARTAYKRTCRKSEKSYRQRLTHKLMGIGLNNPKTFWDIIKKMNNWGKKQVDPADKISCEVWERHFKDHLNDKTPNSQLIDNHNEINTFDPILDSIISDKELRDALAAIKIGKSAGPDKVLGEYLKIFGNICEPIMLKLVRVIFSESSYPEKWTLNFLRPIYQKGSVKDTNNFRDLAIGSVFGKLYSTILLNRFMTYIRGKQLISPKQIGFMKNAGTSDHIFLLQTIIAKVVNKNKNKLYTAFIEFKKAYDTVNRKSLLERLKILGINGLFFLNIAAMYRKTEYRIKLSSGNSQNIVSNLGLKQGCPLSPMLFNLYMDDIDEIFDESCQPVDIQNESLNHFL